MSRNGYLWASGVNLDTAVRLADTDFLLATFSVDFCILYAECQPYFYFRFVWPTGLEIIPHSSTPTLFEVHMTIHCVFVCWYITWLRDLDFWPFDLEQLLCMAGHVTNFATKFEDPTPISSWFMSHNVSPWLPLKMRTWPLRMRRITWPVCRGSKTITFLVCRTRFAYSLCNFGGSMMKVIKVICKNNARPCVKRLWVSANVRNHVIC